MPATIDAAAISDAEPAKTGTGPWVRFRLTIPPQKSAPNSAVIKVAATRACMIIGLGGRGARPPCRCAMFRPMVAGLAGHVVRGGHGATALLTRRLRRVARRFCVWNKPAEAPATRSYQLV